MATRTEKQYRDQELQEQNLALLTTMFSTYNFTSLLSPWRCHIRIWGDSAHDEDDDRMAEAANINGLDHNSIDTTIINNMLVHLLQFL